MFVYVLRLYYELFASMKSLGPKNFYLILIWKMLEVCYIHINLGRYDVYLL